MCNRSMYTRSLVLLLSIVAWTSFVRATNESTIIVTPGNWPKPTWEKVLGSNSRTGLSRLVTSIPRQEGDLSPENDQIATAIVTTVMLIVLGTLASMLVISLVLHLVFRATNPSMKVLWGFKITNIVFVLGAFALSLLANLSFFDNFAGSSGALEQTRTLYDDTIVFMCLQGDRIGALNSNVSNAADNITVILTGVEALESGPDRIIDSLNEFNATYDHLVVNVGGTDWVCLFCLGIGTMIRPINEQIETTASPVFQAISEEAAEVRTEFVSTIDNIVGGLSQGQTAVVGAANEISDRKADFHAGINSAKQAEEARFTGLMILSITALALLPISCLSCCIKNFKYFKWLLVWATALIMVAVAAAHLTIAIAIHDSCNYLDEKENQITVNRAGNDAFQTAIGSCLTNEGLASAFGYQDQLDFANSIDLNTNFDVDRSFNFTFLDDFVNNVDLLTPRLAFGFDATSLIDDPLNSFNTDPNLTNGALVYDRTNISTANEADAGSAGAAERAQVRDNILQMIFTESVLADRVSDMQNDAREIQATEQFVQAEVQRSVDDVQTIASIVTPVQRFALQYLDETRCGNLGQGYVDSKARICSGIQASSALVYIALTLQAILLVFAMQFAAAVIMRKLQEETHMTTERQDYFHGMPASQSPWKVTQPPSHRSMNSASSGPVMMAPISNIGKYVSRDNNSFK